MGKLIKTSMLKKYILKFMLRLVIFLSVLGVYIFRKQWLYEWMTQFVWTKITPLHVLWLIFMIMMIRHFIPRKKNTMAAKKADEREYIEIAGYSKLEMYEFIKDQNIKAWIVMITWLVVNCIFGGLYLLNILDCADLLMLTVFYFLCDYICILFYCPFQLFIMKNKCCVNCRIYDWGHFMMFLPMLFIKGFFSWSLFFTSCIVLIYWEIRYAKHPERYWSGSNQVLQCGNCKDKTCQIKKGLYRKCQKFNTLSR